MSTPDLAALVRHALVQRQGEVVLDLAGVTFAGTELINALVGLVAESTRTGSRLSIRETPDHVQRMLGCAGISDWGRRAQAAI